MKMYQLLKRIFISLICALMLTSIGVHRAYASSQQQRVYGEVVYHVIYPDNKTVVEVKTEKEANKLIEEYKTKVLYTGTTDESGNIVLPDWFTEGEIYIKETVIPEGYTADATEKTLDLSEKETTFENKKKEEQKPLEEPKPVEEPKKETPRPVSIPKTGINSFLKDLFDKLLKPFNESAVLEPEPDKEVETADFTIHKVDQDKKPLKGATFEVYGKPIKKLKVKVTINKEYLYPGASSPVIFEDMPVPPETDEDLENKRKQINLHYIETNIYIKVAGDGFEEAKLFSPDNNVGVYVLDPGEYIISEITNLVGQPYDLDSINTQYYLQSFGIQVKEDGEIIKKGTAEWAALERNINEDANRAEYFMNPVQTTSDSPYSVQMANGGIIINNYSYGQEMCPPKCQ